MSLDVTQGSVVAVDPDELRAIAARLEQVVAAADWAVGCARRSESLQAQLPLDRAVFWTGAGAGRDSCLAVYDEATELVAALRLAGDTYEAMELQTLLTMHGDGARTADGGSARDQLEALAERNPEAWREAVSLHKEWLLGSGRDLADHFDSPGLPGAEAMAGLVLGMIGMRLATGMGRGSEGEPERARRRAGAVPGVSDRVVPMRVERLVRRDTAPAGLAESISRIPNGEVDDGRSGARVRVDRYTMPDGSERFVAYLSGSRGAPWETSEPFGWRQNLALYQGEAELEGYDFALEALERAGATEGAVVDVTGFSQGSMIAQRLATDSAFDVQHVTTIGAPLRVPMGEQVTSLTLAHEDDPVAALADGGSPARLGDDDSLVISRAYEEARTGLLEWDVAAHRVSAYAETAAIFEESGDPRAESVRAYFARLAEAAEVETFFFHAPGADEGARRTEF